jgi:hypothetical protein
VTQRRGEMIQGANGLRFMATVHPSSILRAPDSETRETETMRFIEDLRAATRGKPQPDPRFKALITPVKVRLPSVR